MLQTTFGTSCMNRFLSGIRDSRKAGSLWGMMRGVGGVWKSIDQSWLAKELRLGLICWRFKAGSGKDSVGRGQHSSNRVSGISNRTMHQSTTPSFSQTKLRGCRYETIEVMKEAVTKVIDGLTQEDFHGAFQKLLER